MYHVYMPTVELFFLTDMCSRQRDGGFRFHPTTCPPVKDRSFFYDGQLMKDFDWRMCFLRVYLRTKVPQAGVSCLPSSSEH